MMSRFACAAAVAGAVPVVHVNVAGLDAATVRDVLASSGLEPERPSERKLDASRVVNEVDCTKPIENWSANLKCK